MRYTCDAEIGRPGALHGCNRPAAYEVVFAPWIFGYTSILHYCRRHYDRVEKARADGAEIREMKNGGVMHGRHATKSSPA